MEVRLVQNQDVVWFVREDGKHKDFEYSYIEYESYYDWCEYPFYSGYRDVVVLPEAYMK